MSNANYVAISGSERLQRRRLTGTERMREARQRKAEGYLVVPVEVHRNEVLELVQIGLLRADLKDNRKAVGVAVGDLLGKTFPTALAGANK